MLGVRTGEPLVVAEAKKQGVGGNAIERWFKNWMVFRCLGVHTYVTFCAGDGFFDGCAAQRSLELAVALEDTEAHRVADGEVWNTPTGRLWLYRYRRGTDTAELEGVLRRALDAAAART